jgi:hypothetical protein
MKLYTQTAVNDFVFGKLADMGYEIHTRPSVLVDEYICVAPNDEYMNVLFLDKYLNEWSSALRMRKCRKLPKWAEDFIANENND